MMKYARRYTWILTMICIFLGLLTGCGKVNKAEKTFEKYEKLWTNKDYKAMYEMLSTSSKSYITEEEFVERYTNIYSAIGANNLVIEVNGDPKQGEKDIVIPFQLKMNTLAGELKLTDFKVSMVEENDDYKVNWKENLIFPKMEKGDKVRLNVREAKRGRILDKDGNPLAEDGIVKQIGIHPVVFDVENKQVKIKEIARILDISEETITKKLEANANPDYFVPIVDILQRDSKFLELVSKNLKGLVIKDKESRVYSGGESVGRLIGYIGNITSEELEKNADKGYTSTSLIGKTGLEQVYEDTLRKHDAIEIYMEKGKEKEKVELINRQAENGKDIKLSIDLGLQNKIYSEMAGEKGAAAAVNPKTGEVLALVSSPSYDSNVFTTYTTKTQKDLWEKNNYSSQENRFNKTYAPGSTMKLLTASIGLEQGVIKPEEARDIKGEKWQNKSNWGGYNITRVVDPGKPVNLRDAINYSDNIYFAQVALEVGGEKFVDGIKKFGIGEELQFEYPMETSKISDDGNLKDEIKLADTGYGQGNIMVTPLNMALAYSALGNEGNIMQPRLVISENNEPKVWKEGAISKENLPSLLNGFTALINDSDGTISDGKVPGFRLAGKTGTAEIKKSQDDKEGIENGWFVEVNPEDSKIALSMIMENVKDRGGSHFTVPKVKNSIEYYLNKK